MEYEIEDESRLFDDSTNPSLKHEDRRARRKQSSVSPQDYPEETRRMQKALLIPEEDEQPS